VGAALVLIGKRGVGAFGDQAFDAEGEVATGQVLLGDR